MVTYSFCNSFTNYARTRTQTVNIGDMPLGSNYPIRLQSMTNTDTLDTKSSVEQCIRMIEAGCDYVRLTTRNIEDAENLREIKKQLKLRGFKTPLIADVHFNPRVAEVAASIVEKVRINPGNYADKKSTAQLHYTDQEYTAELERIRERIQPLITICKQHGTAIRIGSNHGSLSDRIRNRYGNTPKGMVEAAMEFLRICTDLDFNNIVVSMKSSNTRIMVQSTRLLVETMHQENMFFPVHLGVTEAGEGEDGRIRSAIGIGALLEDGIGDTIRVSLSEEPEHELPVARMLADRYKSRNAHVPMDEITSLQFNPFSYSRRKSTAERGIGGDYPIRVSAEIKDVQQQTISTEERIESIQPIYPVIIETTNAHGMAAQRAFINAMMQHSQTNPIICKRSYSGINHSETAIHAAADLGALLLDGLCDGIMIENKQLTASEIESLEYSILQAAGARISKAEFISCPTCGRTQFNLTKAIADVKSKTAHLTGLKIAVMGCIVNGPGEMADADYGYVGMGNNKVSIFKKQTAVYKQVPEDEATDKLIQLIKDSGDWQDIA